MPDAYVRLRDSGSVVIGEAKSLGDLENQHTEAQITAFMRRCGTAAGSALIVAVPWPVERLAFALVRNIRTKEDLSHVETVVISDANPRGLSSLV